MIFRDLGIAKLYSYLLTSVKVKKLNVKTMLKHYRAWHNSSVAKSLQEIHPALSFCIS